jgi:hypothetical protein
MRHALFIISVIGTLLFGMAFSLSFMNPLLVERAAREIVRIEVERRVEEKISHFSNAGIVVFAQRALRRTDDDIARRQQAIRDEVPRKIANVVADMLNADCECRKRIVKYTQQTETERLSSLHQVRTKLVTLIESAYASVTHNLMREFRIFTASNAAAFGLLAIVTLVRRGATLQLALPAVVLVGAVAVTGSVYLFNQNWLHTIIFAQYVGLAYTAYLISVALLLTDIVFNHARVTTRIVRFIFDTVGSATPVVPC